MLLLLAVGAACDGPARDSGGAEGSPAALYYDELDGRANTWVDETLASLSLRERIAQLVVPWIPGGYASSSDASFRTLERWVTEEGIGGVVISIGSPHSYASLLNRLQNAARVPLLVTADFENGGPGMRVNHSYALPTLLPQGGGTSFPPTMAFGAIGDPAFAHEYGRITAVEARALGVHLNFAPVLDVNSNPENPIINTRAFGEDPEAVARLGTAYIEGAREGGVLTTAKHFPGHGDTRTDSHIELPIVTADRERLEAMELVPFRRAVSAGVDAVMTAHVAVPGILGSDVPATLSPYFLTELLREDMEFDGLIFTDALRMGAISRGYGAGEAAVLALEAGSDVLLVPEDVSEAIDAVEVAVRTGRVARERIDRSVRLLLAAKARVGLHEHRTVDLAAVPEVAGSAGHLTFADLAAERSVTLVRDRDGLVPLPADARGRVVSVTYARDQDLIAGIEFNRVAAHFVDALVSRRLDEGSDAAAYQAVQDAARDADVVLLNVYVPPFAGAGSVAVPDALRDMVGDLSARGAVVVSSFGNPYSLSAFEDLGSYLIAWGSHEVSQRAGAFALMGAAEISGTLPISIPPDHAAGDGLRRDALPEPAAIRDAVMAVPSWVVQPLEFVTAARTADDDQEAQGQISPLEGDPAAAGMSAAVLEALDRRILDAIADSASPGAALAVVRHGQLVRLRGYGRLDWDPASAPATPFLHLRHGLGHQGDGHHHGRDDPGGRGPPRPGRPRGALPPVVVGGRPAQGGGHRAPVAAAPGRAASLPTLLPGDGGRGSLPAGHRRAAPRLHAGGQHGVFGHRHDDRGVGDRGDHRPAAGPLPGASASGRRSACRTPASAPTRRCTGVWPPPRSTPTTGASTCAGWCTTRTRTPWGA